MIDSPLMRSAGREMLSLALMDARNHTLHLFSQYQLALQDQDLQVPFAETINPPLWELGHAGWFQEWWIGRNMQRSLGEMADNSHTRLASIEPEADTWWHPAHAPHRQRWSQVLPAVDPIRAYLLDTLECSLDLLEKTADDDQALYVYRLSLFHEDMQGERLVQTAQTIGMPLEQALRDAFVPARLSSREALLMPASSWKLGSKAAPGFSFDNEKPQHMVQVPEFEIDAQPVSWAQYVEFVDDGGYDRAELWQPDGWRWLQGLAAGEGRRGPRYVDQIGVASGAVMQTRFGQPMRMHGGQPAMHMSWWEADAWCRWAGRRLPAEAEWELAAHTAGGRGFRWGDVWEWTASSFRPYDSSAAGSAGFMPGPNSDYSQPFFGTHKVLRGASFATRARMKHAKFRRFCLPERDELFCGFRSCAL
ncbi:MAG: hypothetical protein JWP47_2099 [Polaromonas sp.]|nr:hypothetical protein [Polaromonas sp.]